MEVSLRRSQAEIKNHYSEVFLKIRHRPSFPLLAVSAKQVGWRTLLAQEKMSKLILFARFVASSAAGITLTKVGIKLYRIT